MEVYSPHKKRSLVFVFSCNKINYGKWIACTMFVFQSLLLLSHQQLWVIPWKIRSHFAHLHETQWNLMFSEMTGNSDLGFWIESICPSNGCQTTYQPQKRRLWKQSLSYWGIQKLFWALAAICSLFSLTVTGKKHYHHLYIYPHLTKEEICQLKGLAKC